MSRKCLVRPEENSGNRTGWLTTFNDLVTLLMVFFVLLFTMGSMDNNLMKEFQNALQSGLGVLGAGSKVSVAVNESPRPVSLNEALPPGQVEKKTADGKSMADPVEEALSEIAAEPGINVQSTDQGARIFFEDELLFDFGKAHINSSGFFLLDEMATLLQKLPGTVRVEGHTDNVPIHTQRYPSNWDLSTARAVSVLKYLIDVGGINPQRLSAVGYGESRPMAPNDSAANRAKNRRVEIVLVMEGKKQNVK
jgi:chemotaxis protein MotB